MPVQGICHAFQLVQSLCFFALAQFESYDLPMHSKNLGI